MPSVRDAQAPLRARYKADPAAAAVVDRARSMPHDLSDPFHACVHAQGGAGGIPVAIHAGHGGPHDGATPGDLLCAALGCCQELTIRMVANLMGLELATLEVSVEGDVDLRGSLGMPGVPVGFSRVRVRVRVNVKNGGPAEIDKLLRTAQGCCVVGETLRAGVAVEYLTA